MSIVANSAASSVNAWFWYSLKAYSALISSAVFAVMVMCRIVSVQLSSVSSSGLLSGWGIVSTSEATAHISQNTARSSSTRSGVRAATSTPLSAPAVFAANTATTSRQSGPWP